MLLTLSLLFLTLSSLFFSKPRFLLPSHYLPYSSLTLPLHLPLPVHTQLTIACIKAAITDWMRPATTTTSSPKPPSLKRPNVRPLGGWKRGGRRRGDDDDDEDDAASPPPTPSSSPSSASSSASTTSSSTPTPTTPTTTTTVSPSPSLLRWRTSDRVSLNPFFIASLLVTRKTRKLNQFPFPPFLFFCRS